MYYTNRLNLQVNRDEAYRSASVNLFAYQIVCVEGVNIVTEIMCSTENLLFFQKKLKEYNVELIGIWTGHFSYIYFNIADLHKVIKCLNKIFDTNITKLNDGYGFFNKEERLI